MNQDNAKSEILIIHTWGLGDLILMTPVLEIAANHYPELRIDLVVFPTIAAEPISNAPYIRRIIYARWTFRRLFSSLRELRRVRYIAALFSSGVTPWKAWLFLLLVRAETKIGEYRRGRYPMLDKYVKFDDQRSRTEANYLLFREFLPLPEWQVVIKNRDQYKLRTRYYLRQEEINWAEEYRMTNGLDKDRIMGIHPGCMASNKFRRWPREHFIDLIRLIQLEGHFKPVVIAGPDELELGKDIAQTTNSLLLTGQPLGNVAAFISICNFFVNTDSSLGHVASCFSIPSLTIFGPGNELETAPFSRYSKTLRLDMKCAPCLRRKTRKCSVECLRLLSAEAVFANISRVDRPKLIGR